MRKKVWLFALAAVLLVILAGCRGNELPDGMDEDKVSSAGLAVMSQLTKGEYEAVYDALREDVREQTSADAIEEMMDIATEGRGSFKKVKDSMVTGVTDAAVLHAYDEHYGELQSLCGRAACHRRHRREIRQKVRGVPHRVRYGDEPYRTGCEREVSR